MHPSKSLDKRSGTGARTMRHPWPSSTHLSPAASAKAGSLGHSDISSVWLKLATAGGSAGAEPSGGQHYPELVTRDCPEFGSQEPVASCHLHSISATSGKGGATKRVYTDVVLTIKPEVIKLLAERTKNHEYRKYKLRSPGVQNWHSTLQLYYPKTQR
ncbi:hypothetical protein M422DRAFT_251141 [Sphaerobolus stellatus SS14]|uniref:Uncharacterized protein n=1 Tax=Sphaerobolus stellatus (strain SS14) TaxID=990650 RepID=A0A0C9VEB3_SPHS4|nr:hypothetical protein M422DRAFT_251141 [Sphaerobolus stellatus SS14]